MESVKIAKSDLERSRNNTIEVKNKTASELKLIEEKLENRQDNASVNGDLTSVEKELLPDNLEDQDHPVEEEEEEDKLTPY